MINPLTKRLYSSLKEEKKLNEALLIIRGTFQKNQSSSKLIIEYISLLMDVVAEASSAAAADYYKEANKALEKYSVASRLNKDRLQIYQSQKLVLKDMNQMIIDKSSSEVVSKKTTGANKNREILTALAAKLNLIDEITDHDSFSRYLDEIKEEEKALDLENLDDSMRAMYENLIASYAEHVGHKTTYFDLEKKRQYNTRALKDMEEMMNHFIKYKRRYIKDFEKLQVELTSYLFKYDVKLFFYEVEQYYQYCFNYIFSRLDNTSKAQMSELSLVAKKVY